jgi:hypothetical protein
VPATPVAAPLAAPGHAAAPPVLLPASTHGVPGARGPNRATPEATWPDDPGADAPGSEGTWSSGEALGRRILFWLDGTRRACGLLPEDYRASCLVAEYRALVGRIPPGRYDPARAVMIETYRRIEALAAPALEPARPAVRVEIRPRGTLPARRTPPIVPVRRASAAAINAAAAAVLDAAELTLLRSVPDADPRAASFQRIAAAFGDNAVLLRS